MKAVMKRKNETAKIQWLEVVRLRTSPNDAPKAIEAAKKLLNDIEANTDGIRTGLMQDAQGLGDIEAVLVWEKGQCISKTREGYIVAEKFREFGTTNHDVRQVVQGFEGCACGTN